MARPSPLAALDAEELKSLQFFAALHGRCWRTKLRAAWESGNYPLDFREKTESQLQGIRNRLGPSFLGTFTTPDLEAA